MALVQMGCGINKPAGGYSVGEATAKPIVLPWSNGVNRQLEFGGSKQERWTNKKTSEPPESSK
jgi:hypothetical protein